MSISLSGLRVGYKDCQGTFYGKPNSADGVSVKGVVTNNSSKTIGFIVLYFTPHNADGEVVACSIRNTPIGTVKCSVALKPGKRLEFFGENLWYNPSIVSASVSSAKLEFTDGTSETLIGPQIKVVDGARFKKLWREFSNRFVGKLRR